MTIWNEPLLIKQSIAGLSGVDIENVSLTSQTGLPERENIGLPQVSEPQVVRHFTRLSQMNYGIDTTFYPLGSCTMKHNPRINEKVARLEGLASLHPLQPENTVQGALKIIYELQEWLKELTGLPGITLNPAAGAHGELCGAMIIRAAHEKKGNPRHIILIPDAAHGTNPATAAMCGYTCKTIPSTSEGLVDMNALHEAISEHGTDIAAFMLTNPNTCGLFEPNMLKIAEALHNIGAYFYCDGANFNAIVGKVKPADLGVDVMQMNLHKTFSTPHGGGGPGSGPVAVCDELKEFLPIPLVEKRGDTYKLITESENSIGRIRAFHGQFGMMVRALAYMMSHGADGLKQVAEDAVLNANYIYEKLKPYYHAPFDGRPCMHECLINDKKQRHKGITTMEIAKRLLDEGFHPMTVYFPLVVNGAMLIEPTETESKQTLDEFIAVMIKIAKEVENESAEDLQENFSACPLTTPKRRLDETTAARKPILRT